MPEPWQQLLVKNKHIRDNNIRFHEPSHTYYINGSSEKIISCTKFIHDFFPHFDPDTTIEKMMKSKNWSSSPYYGKSAESIKKEWSSKGDNASKAGTAMHLAIEQYLNDSEEVINNEIKETLEWKYFMNFWSDYKNDLVPYRTEWEVWMDEFRLCGSIDMVFYQKSTDSYVIYDWKRSKDIKISNDFANGYGPLEHLPDSNYWRYTLQLNVYKYFLENYYNLKISELCLVILHPDNKNYKLIRLNILDDEVSEMLKCRTKALTMNSKKSVII